MSLYTSNYFTIKNFECLITIIINLPTNHHVYNRFPKDEVLKKLWLDACCFKQILPSHRICNNHFTKESFNESGYLSKKAVPFVA